MKNRRVLGLFMAGVMVISNVSVRTFAEEMGMPDEELIIRDDALSDVSDDELNEPVLNDEGGKSINDSLFGYDYTVIWNAGDGDLSSDFSDDPSLYEDEYLEGENIRLFPEEGVIAPEDRFFKGWSKDGTEDGIIDFEEYWIDDKEGGYYDFPVNCDMTFTAMWGSMCTVSWYAGEGEISSEYGEAPFVYIEKYQEGETLRPISEVELIAPENKCFIGWSTDGTEEGLIDFDTLWIGEGSDRYCEYFVYEDLQFTAIWSEEQEALGDNEEDQNMNETEVQPFEETESSVGLEAQSSEDNESFAWLKATAVQYKTFDAGTDVAPKEEGVVPDEFVVSEGNITKADLTWLSVRDLVSIHLFLSLGISEERTFFADDRIDFSIPDQINIEQILLSGDSAETVSCTVKDGTLAFRFLKDAHFDSEDLIANVECVFSLNKDRFSAEMENTVCILKDDEPALVFEFSKLDLPNGIIQTGEKYRDSNVEGLLVHVTVGAYSEGTDLGGFSIVDTYAGDKASLYGVFSDSGEELEYEESDVGIVFTLPEESQAPWSYDIVIAPESAPQEGETWILNNIVKLSNPKFEATSQLAWEDSYTCELEGRERMLTWKEYYTTEIEKYDISALTSVESKKLYIEIYRSYQQYKKDYTERMEEAAASDTEESIISSSDQYVVAQDVSASSKSGTISNNYIEAAIGEGGRFSIGNIEGDPSYASDNNQILLFGHPSPGTSETLIKIDGEEIFFEADNVFIGNDSASAIMTLEDYNVSVLETLSLISSGAASYKDCIKITYQIANNSNKEHNVGIRIMLDTMLADNDDAPFKIPGIGNLTSERTFTGSNIPAYYQVYDYLDNPTTLATGYLVTKGERIPDKVQFALWGDIDNSSWDYSTGGNHFGDSAVGIYFNPASVSPGQSFDVSTRYGVGLGTKGGVSGKNAVKANEVQFELIDNDTSLPIKGVTVSSETGASAQTGTDGIVSLNISDVDNKKLDFSASGYSSFSEEKKRQGGYRYTLRLSKVGSQIPIIRSVTMGGDRDILSDTVTYLEDVSGLIPKANTSDITEVKMKVNASGTNNLFYLMKDQTVVAKSQNGVFTFKTVKGNNNSEVYIEKLSAGERYFIKVVSEGEVALQQIGLKIYSPGLAFKTGGLTDAVFSLGKGSGNVTNLLMEILAGGSTFDFGLNPFKFNADLDPEKQSIKIGLNVKPELLNKSNKTIYDGLLRSMEKYSKTDQKDLGKGEISTFQKSLNAHQAFKGNYKIGAFSTGVSVMGMGEFVWDKDNVHGTFYLTVAGSVGGSMTYNFWIWAIPVYFTVGYDGKIEMHLFGEMVFKDGDDFLKKLYNLLDSFIFDFGLYGELGVGHDIIAKVGGKLRGGINYMLNFHTLYNKLSLNGSVSLEAKAFFWEKSWELAKGSWTIADGYLGGDGMLHSSSVEEPRSKEEGTYLSAAFEELMTQPTTMEGRDYLSLEDSPDNAEATLTNVYTQAEPFVTNVNGVPYRFYLNDNRGREPQNRTMLVYSYQTNGEWSDPLPVEDDGTADFSYDIAVQGSTIYVIWQDCKQVYGSNIDLATMCKGVKVSFAKINTLNNEVSVWAVPVLEDTMNQSLALYADTSNIYLAWNSVQSNAFEPVTGSKLNYLSWNTSRNQFSTLKSVDLPDKNVQQMSIQRISGQIKAAYTLVKWEDSLSQNSQETKYLTLSSSTIQNSNLPITESEFLYATLGGSDYVFWYRDHNFWYSPVNGNPSYAEKVFDEPLSFLSSNYTVIASGVNTYLIWVGADTGEQAGGSESHKAYATEYKNGRWCPPYVMTDLGEGTVSSLSGVSGNDGRLMLSWQITSFTEDGVLISSELRNEWIGNNEGYTNLELSYLTYDEAGGAYGEDFTVTLTLSNKGSSIIDHVTAWIETEEERFDYVLDNLKLNPGETVLRDVTFRIPDEGPLHYYVGVDTENEQDSSDNTDQFIMGGAILEASYQKLAMMGEAEVLLLEVSNKSNVPAENVRIIIEADEDGGVVIYNNTVDIVDPLSSVYMSVPAEAFDEVHYARVLLSADTALNCEPTPLQLAYSNEMLSIVGEHEVAITSSRGGDARCEKGTQAMFVEGESVALYAEPNDGFVFWSWHASSEGTEFADEQSAETTMIVPAENVIISAEFRPEKAVESLTASLEKNVIQVGETISVNATVLPKLASTHVTYMSSDETVASIDRNGVISGEKAGDVIITVFCGELEETLSITVEEVEIESINIPGPVYLFGIEASEDLMPELTPRNASSDVKWSSSNPDVISVDEHGTVTSKGKGSATVTAVSVLNESVSASVVVHSTIELAGIQLNKYQIQMEEDESETVMVDLFPADNSFDGKVSWSNYDTDVIRIETSGIHDETAVVTAVGRGFTTVQVSAGQFTKVLSVNIIKKIESITVSDRSLTLKEGRQYDMYYTVTPEDSDEKIEWSSTNENVATVSSYGRIYAHRPGVATIRVQSKSGGARAECRVTVTSANVIVSSIDQLQSKHNPYENDMDDSWVLRIPGAPGLNVIFDPKTETEEGYDYIFVYDMNGKEIGQWSGTELSSKKVYVPGDTIKIRMITDGSDADYYGFKISSVTVSNIAESNGNAASKPQLPPVATSNQEVQVPPAVIDPITILKTPSSVKAKAKKSKVTVSWKKIKKTKKTKALLKQIKSIQIQYSTDPTFTQVTGIKSIGKKKTKAVLKLKKKTTYYIRVRYVGVGGYSNWSGVKKVKTK